MVQRVDGLGAELKLLLPVIEVFLINEMSQLFGPSARTPEKRDGKVRMLEPSCERCCARTRRRC